SCQLECLFEFGRVLFFFSGVFFASVRRHTSSKRDWSSDVCSSDLGGFIGLVIGIVASNLIASALGVAANFTLGSVLLVLGFSSAVGIFFGIYPARKAAHLNPIDYLRHE